MSATRCTVCARLLHDDDEVVFTGEAIYHLLPSAVNFAISDISACYDLAHKYCEPKGATE